MFSCKGDSRPICSETDSPGRGSIHWNLSCPSLMVVFHVEECTLRGWTALRTSMETKEYMWICGSKGWSRKGKWWRQWWSIVWRILATKVIIVLRIESYESKGLDTQINRMLQPKRAASSFTRRPSLRIFGESILHCLSRKVHIILCMLALQFNTSIHTGITSSSSDSGFWKRW